MKRLVIREGLRVDLLPLYIERSQLMWFGRVLLAKSPEHPGGITLWSRKASMSLGRARGGQGEGGPGNSAFRGGGLSREVAENGCRGGYYSPASSSSCGRKLYGLHSGKSPSAAVLVSST